MLIDFGNGEAIMARHEEFAQRDLEARALRQTASQTQAQRGWLSHYSDQLRCELDYYRLVLAEKLERFALAQSVLHADDTRLFSSTQCR